MQSKSLIVATAGHVDHGKTSLVNFITGTDTDTLAEEKQRGVTINLGFAYHQFIQSIDNETYKCTLGFVYVPGHNEIYMAGHIDKTQCAFIGLVID